MSLAHARTPEPANRRRHTRFVTPPMYTGIAVRRMDEEHFRAEGHAYNLSEGGIQFELDDPIAPGTTVALRIDLPILHPGAHAAPADVGPGRAVFVIGNVVWIDDDAPSGPFRHAVAFTRFCRLGDRERLLQQLHSGVFTIAA